MQKLDKSKLIMGLSKKYKLAPYLDKVFADFDEPWEFKQEVKEPDDAWHPSGDCTPSPLQLYLKAQAHLEDGSDFSVSGSLRKSFGVGHYWHQLLQHIVLNKLKFCTANSIERKGYRAWGSQTFSPEDLFYLRGLDDEEFKSAYWVPADFRKPKGNKIKTIPFHWVAGSADICPIELPKGWKGIVDFKTMNAQSFKSTAVPFADKYECQMNIYMDLFDEDQALILGVNKDSPHDFKEFVFERNEPLIDTIYDKWHYVSECLVAGKAPHEGEEYDLPLAGPVVA